MYDLLSHVPDGLKTMRQGLQDHAAAAAEALVGDEALQGDSVELLSRLLGLRDQLHGLLTRAVRGDRGFLTALGQAFKAVLNKSGRCARSAEHLGAYVDAVLQGRGAAKGMPEAGVERALDSAMALFRHLEDKDLFEATYRELLSRRLLGGKVAQEEQERAMLARLKAECGNQYTQKLESMFWDTHTSAEMNAEFRSRSGAGASASGADGAEVSVQVLTQGAWPSKGVAACTLPEEVAAGARAFEEFYLSTHAGRKLGWQTAMGHAEVRFETAQGRAFDLVVSTHQMAILALFNGRDQATAREIGEETGMDAGEMERALLSMACVKGRNVLKKEPMSGVVDPADVFSVNEAFDSKLKRVKIGTIVAQREAEQDRGQTLGQVEAHRKPLVEAAVMRVMKSRRRLEHNALVAQATQQLASHFTVPAAKVKQVIESLLEREYLERDASDRRIYNYVS